MARRPSPQPGPGPLSYLDKVRWVEVSNESTEDAPGGALLMVTGGGTDDGDEIDDYGIPTVDQPDADGLVGLLVAHPAGIPAGGRGLATPGDFVPVVYDDAETPAVGETWGSAAGSWKLTKGMAGWVIAAPPTASQDLVLVECWRVGSGAEWFIAQLTSGASPYSWQERVETAAGVWADGPRSGTSNAYQAQPSTGTPPTPAVNDLVLLRASPAVDGAYEFVAAGTSGKPSRYPLGPACQVFGPGGGFVGTYQQWFDPTTGIVQCIFTPPCEDCDPPAGSSETPGVGGAPPTGTGIVVTAGGAWGTPGPLTGDVETTGAGLATTIKAKAVTLAKMNDVATATVFYRKTAGTGVPEVQALATLKTDLGLTGTNSGDQDLSSYAPLASPAFTGTPTVPTAAAGTNTTQVASTAFVTAAVSAGMPVGTVAMWLTATPPTDWLICDGSSFSSGTYPALNTLLGGTTLPDLRGRSPMGAGTGSGLTARTLGSNYGSETHTLSTAEMPSHTHDAYYASVNVQAGATAFNQVVGPPTTPISSSSAGSGAAHANVHPVQAVHFIIKAK